MNHILGCIWKTASGNVFRADHIYITGQVHLTRIGVVRDGDYDESNGIPAIVHESYIHECEISGGFIPCELTSDGILLTHDQIADMADSKV